ncbi:MAG: hypothetical protein AAGA01_15250 [Cyanobacteria bacterium P01_E01_bin.43]
MTIEAPIWIYWVFCSVATLAVLKYRQQIPQLLSPTLGEVDSRSGYLRDLGIGWVTTLVAAALYVLFTQKYETGPYQLPDLVIFSAFNGILEQFMFVFWFLLGCYGLRALAGRNSRWLFAGGYIGYAVYSGFIHALFWVKVLPDHNPVAFMAGALAAMSLAWMWLYWRYRAFWQIVLMHVAIDFLTVGHLHFTWFEPIQAFTP